MSKKHFIFDLDDTLVDSYEFNQQMFVDTFKPHIDASKKEVDDLLRNIHKQNKGTSMAQQFENAINLLSINVDTGLLVEANENLHIERLLDVKLFDSVQEVIKVLKERGKEISLISNRQTKSLRMVLKKNNVDTHFTNIISCSDEGYEKPDPHCLNKLIEGSAYSKDEFIYFGDSKTDYEFATRAGVDCIIIDHYVNQKKFYKLILESFF